MNKQKAIEILEQYNKWRRANEDMDMPDPKEIGKAIDYVINHLKHEK